MRESCNNEHLKDAKNLHINRLLNLTVYLSQNDFFATTFSLTNNNVKLIRNCSFIFSFLNQCKKLEPQPTRTQTNLKLKVSESYLIKQVQHFFFVKDIKNSENQRYLSGNSKLKYFNPFLDSEGIIRVGGRLDNSNLSYNKKHPILLPSNHKLSELIFEYFHNKFFHVGPQALLHHVRQNYWILNGRSLARKIVHKCVVCFKNKTVEASQVIGISPFRKFDPKTIISLLIGKRKSKNQKAENRTSLLHFITELYLPTFRPYTSTVTQFTFNISLQLLCYYTWIYTFIQTLRT